MDYRLIYAHEVRARYLTLRVNKSKRSATRKIAGLRGGPPCLKALSCAARAVLTTAALVLPVLAMAASSPMTSRSTELPLRASAHVNFKVVIPAMLSLDVRAQSTTVFSNGRLVVLGPTVRGSENIHGGLLFPAAARKVIEQTVPCRTAGKSSTFCTVSMP